MMTLTQDSNGSVIVKTLCEVLRTRVKYYVNDNLTNIANCSEFLQYIMFKSLIFVWYLAQVLIFYGCKYFTKL